MASYRNTWAEVNLDYIQHNFLQFQNYLHAHNTKVMAIVKANGYGHGAKQVANALVESGADYFGVALLDEALALRDAGITVPILVLGRVSPEYASIAAEYKISLTVYQLNWIEELDPHLDEQLNIHLKFDTGMGRIGIIEEKEARLIVNKIQQDPRLILEGAFSHFATADELDSRLVDQQSHRFASYLSLIKEQGATPEIIHFGNSAGAIRFPAYDQHYVRVGISLYGLPPSEEVNSILPFPLKPSLSLHSQLTHVKKVKPGDTLSYGATYQAVEEEWIGTVPIGYGDGWLRRYGEKGFVLVSGERAKIVGRICMDQLMVRLPYCMDVGTLVTLLGEQEKEAITVDDVAHQNNTINYEIPCLITPRVPRLYKKNNRISKQ